MKEIYRDSHIGVFLCIVTTGMGVNRQASAVFRGSVFGTPASCLGNPDLIFGQ
jgi:hypothetical protein